MKQRSVFEGTPQPTEIPLAEKARPQKLADIFGQDQVLSPSSPLRRMIESDTFGSFILWGPPGTGKTTIAKLIEAHTSMLFLPSAQY